jgi:hypothetical protein
LKKDIGETRRDGTASNSIMATWQISFEHIRKERSSAARLPSLMSLFDRQGIPEYLLPGYEGSDAEDDDNIEFEEDVSTLIWQLRMYSSNVVGLVFISSSSARLRSSSALFSTYFARSSAS